MGSRGRHGQSRACVFPMEKGTERCGVENPTGRRVSELGKEKGKQPSSRKEGGERSGKRGKWKRWSWRMKQALGWLRLRGKQFLGGSAFSQIIVQPILLVQVVSPSVGRKFNHLRAAFLQLSMRTTAWRGAMPGTRRQLWG